MEHGTRTSPRDAEGLQRSRPQKVLPELQPGVTEQFTTFLQGKINGIDCFLLQGQGRQARAVEEPQRSPRTAHRRNTDARHFPGGTRAGWAPGTPPWDAATPPEVKSLRAPGRAAHRPVPSQETSCPPTLVNSTGALASPPRVPAQGRQGTLLAQGLGSTLCCWHTGTSRARHTARPCSLPSLQAPAPPRTPLSSSAAPGGATARVTREPCQLLPMPRSYTKP